MIAGLLLVVFASICGAGPGLRIESESDPTRVRVVAQLPRELRDKFPAEAIDSGLATATLKLCLVGEDDVPGPAIFGEHARRGGSLVFTPRYRLSHDQLYRAYFILPDGKIKMCEYRVPPKPPSERPTVESLYPSGDALPANHLKFYIHFSKPMREGRAIFDGIQLVDEDGELMPDTWRRTELWSDDARRLTLWIHPGRVKQGVNLREEFGPVLEPEKSYSLVIGADVQGADGTPLCKPFVKKFQAVAEDHDRPLPQDWKISKPPAGTTQPLRLEFGEPLDHALLHRLVEVYGADAKPVAGRAIVSDDETKWQFRPSQPWRRDNYRIVVDPLLEDLAGNTPTRLFDRDLQQPFGEAPELTLEFRPQPHRRGDAK